ncbi:unnamed protein product [Closterium sp. NIES-65]|nr:unnamed protein product [Closterium sp. NIES-65]
MLGNSARVLASAPLDAVSLTLRRSYRAIFEPPREGNLAQVQRKLVAMKFGKEFASYQNRLQESTDLTARFPQVNYRALKKILRRCISSRALRAELHAQAEPHAAEAELYADGGAEADAGRAAAEAGREEAKAEFKLSVANCDAVTTCARGELSALSAPAANMVAEGVAENGPPAAADVAGGCAQCDAEFFGLLEAELISIERSFNSAATRLLSCHNARGLQLMCHVLSPRQLFSTGGHGGWNPRWHSHKPAALHHAASSLLEHLAISFLATHKIIKKYIKVHRRTSLSPRFCPCLSVCDGLGTPESWEKVNHVRRLQGRTVRSPLLIEVTAMVANLELVMEGERRGMHGGGRGEEREGLGGGMEGGGRNGRKRGMESLKACAAEGMGPRGERGAEKSGSKKSGTEKSGAQGSGVAASVCPLLGSELLLKAEFRAKVDVTCPVCLAKVDITCPVCLVSPMGFLMCCACSVAHVPEVPFDPVSLACTHIFCRGCACSVAHVPVFFGLDSASPHITCPLCRQQGVFRHPRSLRELHRLIMARQPEEWKARRNEEQKRRLEEERRYWDGQMRIAMHMRLGSLSGILLQQSAQEQNVMRTPARAAYAHPHGGRTPGAPSPLTPYSARIEQLHSTATKAVESAASTAINSAPTSAVASSSPSLSPFRERINDW